MSAVLFDALGTVLFDALEWMLRSPFGSLMLMPYLYILLVLLLIPYLLRVARSVAARIFIIRFRNNGHGRALRYLGSSFSNPAALLGNMAKFNFLLSGSRALGFWFPGSCTPDSDWDFYTYHSPYIIGYVLASLTASGVVWDSAWQSFMDLLCDAKHRGPGSKVLITLREVQHLVDLVDHCHISLGDEFEPILPTLRTFLPQRRPDGRRYRWSSRPLIQSEQFDGISIVVKRVSQEKPTYYTFPNVHIITGRTTYNGTSQKVQLIFAKNKSPIEHVMSFYASHVQCFLSGFGAVHFYFSEAARSMAYFWPKNTQHRPSADAAVEKYNLRGWTFSRPATASAVERIRYVASDGFLVPFRTTDDSQLNAARRTVFEEMQWWHGEVSTHFVKPYNLTLDRVLSTNKRARKVATAGSIRESADLRSSKVLTFAHSAAFSVPGNSDSHRWLHADEVDGF